MNFALGYELAKLCERAYGPEAKRFGNQYALIDVQEDVVNVAWRGTNPDSIHDWLTDFNALLVKNENYPGRVHRGVSTEVDIAWDDLQLELNRNRPMRYNFAGHSLGGGLAEAAAWRARLDFRVDSIWLFAPLRIFDHIGAEIYDNDPLMPEAAVIVNNRDPVPHEPPPVRYSHVGRTVWIDGSGYRHSSWPFWEAFEPDVADHHIGRYVGTMRALAT